MTRTLLYFSIFLSGAYVFGMQVPKQADLVMIKAVTKREDKDHLELIGYLKNGNTITYTETTSGENAGFAHCSSLRLQNDPAIDVTQVGYWATLLHARLDQLRGIQQRAPSAL